MWYPSTQRYLRQSLTWHGVSSQVSHTLKRLTPTAPQTNNFANLAKTRYQDPDTTQSEANSAQFNKLHIIQVTHVTCTLRTTRYACYTDLDLDHKLPQVIDCNFRQVTHVIHVIHVTHRLLTKKTHVIQDTQVTQVTKRMIQEKLTIRIYPHLLFVSFWSSLTPALIQAKKIAVFLKRHL